MNATLIRLAVLAAAATSLTGCAGVIGAKMTYNDTEKAKVTDIVLTGGGGDVTVSTGPGPETTVTRVIRRSSNPGDSYRLDGSTMSIDTDCGINCSVSYQIKAPAGVKVHGRQDSGDIRLSGVADTDIQVASGDVVVNGATGPVRVWATSGDVTVLDAKSTVKLKGTSGDLKAINAGGAVTAEITSGDVTVVLATPASVTAHATSGDVKVTVPKGQYRLVTKAGSGDVNLAGIENDSTAKNVIDGKVSSGDLTVASLP